MLGQAAFGQSQLYTVTDLGTLDSCETCTSFHGHSVNAFGNAVADGTSASFGGDVVVVGALNDDHDGAPFLYGLGAAYVYRSDPRNSQWNEAAKLNDDRSPRKWRITG